MDESLKSELESLTKEVGAWDVLTYPEKARLEALLEAYRENEQVDSIYASLASLELDDIELRRYLKKVEGICRGIEKEIPNICELSHRERGKKIFDELWGVKLWKIWLGGGYIKGACTGSYRQRYRLSEMLDTGRGTCGSLSALIGGIMQRFGLNVVFQYYISWSSNIGHLNIGLMCEDEEKETIIPVESTGPDGYNIVGLDKLLRTNHITHDKNYDSRILCVSNLRWRAMERKEIPFDTLKFDLIQHELLPNDLETLFNIAVSLYNIEVYNTKNPKSKIHIESDVELMTQLLEYTLKIEPRYEKAADFLKEVKTHLKV